MMDKLDSESVERHDDVRPSLPGSNTNPNSSSKYEDLLKCYDFDPTTAHYIIFNNMPEEFDDFDIKDVEMIKSTFDLHGIEGEIHRDKSFRQIFRLLEDIVGEDEKSYGLLFVFILTVANRKKKLLALNDDDNYDFYRELIYPLIPKSGAGFVGIPKVFVVQTYEAIYYEEKEPVTDKEEEEDILIPQYADLYFIFSSVPGKVKIEQETESFIKTFCEIVGNHSGDYDFESLMTIVKNYRLKKNNVVPNSHSTLRFLLNLPQNKQ
ncbi:hypothetical protein CHUAL_011376 [Chamberlinius hualienensis]